MSTDQSLRKHLIELLEGGHAHATFDQVIADFPAKFRGEIPNGLPHSAWMLLEHMRIAQSDILEFSRDPNHKSFSRDPNHKSPKFPDGYWPQSPEPVDTKSWDRSVHGFSQDLQTFCSLIADENTNLYARIPHGDGQTLLREALLIADHNAYHLGQLLIVRRMLGAWKQGA